MASVKMDMLSCAWTCMCGHPFDLNEPTLEKKGKEIIKYVNHKIVTSVTPYMCGALPFLLLGEGDLCPGLQSCFPAGLPSTPISGFFLSAKFPCQSLPLTQPPPVCTPTGI